MLKLMGMVWYEMLMGWRRGATRLILFITVLMPLLGFLLFTSTTVTEQQLAASQMSLEVAQRLHLSLALSDNVFLIPILMILVPVLVAETIPLDRQYNMYEMLRTLPIGVGTYLTAKVLAAVIPVVGAVAAAAGISLIIQRVRDASFETGPLLLFWLGGVLVLAIFASVAGVLMPAMQINRRRGVLVGALAAALSTAVYLLLPLNDILMQAMIETYMVTQNPTLPASALPAYPTLVSGQYLIHYQWIAAALALIWGFMAWRMRNSEPAK